MADDRDDPNNPYRYSAAPPAKEDAAADLPASPALPPGQAAGSDAKLLAQMRGGAGWFYWIVGLSIVNSVLLAMQVGLAFIFGLGITQVLDGLATGLRPELGPAVTVVYLVLYVGVVGVFVLLGYFASRGHGWAFVLGMIAYLLDGLLLLPFEDWLGAGFHALVLYWIWNGFSACRQLRNGPASMIEQFPRSS